MYPAENVFWIEERRTSLASCKSGFEHFILEIVEVSGRRDDMVSVDVIYSRAVACDVIPFVVQVFLWHL